MKHHCLKRIGLLLIVGAVIVSMNPSVTQAETTQQRDARMHWWRAARFGMFIHWGLYAVPAG